MNDKITWEEEREAYEQYLNTLNAMAQKEIDGLKAKLTLSTKREERYRKALERVNKLTLSSCVRPWPLLSLDIQAIVYTALNEGY